MPISLRSPFSCLPLKVKLLASFFVIVIALLVATAYAVSSAAKKHSMNLLIENMKISQSVVSDHINDTIYIIDKAAHNLTSDFNVKTLILNVDNDKTSLAVALNNFARRFETSEFALTDPQGNVKVNSANFELRSIDEIAKYASEGAVWLQMNDSFYLNIVVPVKNTPLSRNAMAYLIFAKKLNEVFDSRLAGLSNYEVNAVTRSNNTYNALSASGRNEDTVIKIFENQILITDSIATADVSDEVFFSTKLLLDTINQQVWLMLVTPEDVAFLSYKSIFKQLSILLLFSTVLVSLFALFISNRISTPILRLIELTTKIGHGDNEIEIPDGGTIEVKKLANAMAQMNVQLNQRSQEIQTLAFEDELTNLPNKNALIRHLDNAFDARNSAAVVLILLDIAKFTDLNSAIGYQAADGLLIQIAQRLRAHLSAPFFVARVSGNQFAIATDSNTSITATIDNIVECIHRPFNIDNLNLGVTAKIGYAYSDREINDSRRLTQSADIALKVAKHSFNPSVKYEHSLYLFDTRKLRLMSEISSITKNGQLSLHYQPQLNLQTNRVDSVECLARWIHPEEGFVPPDLFIGIAEQTGDIKKITRWVICEALKQHNQWKRKGYHLQMSANISAIDLTDESFVSFVTDSLAKYRVDANDLMLEVTESTAMEEPEVAIQALINLSKIGIKLSIDDFGTGYSSMAQLKKMPVKELKIDKAFVLELAKSPDDQNMVKTFIALAHNMGLKTVAEGVEDHASLTLLSEFGCTYGQGYFISRPMDSRATLTWFENAQYGIQLNVAERSNT